MTINKDHGINHRSLVKFLSWLSETVEIDLTGFYFGFIVPTKIAKGFPKQKFLTGTNTVHQKAGNLRWMNQWVVSLDVVQNQRNKLEE